MHSLPVPINVGCYSSSDLFIRRSEVKPRASFGPDQILLNSGRSDTDLGVRLQEIWDCNPIQDTFRTL
jgi:hypothetical protein